MAFAAIELNDAALALARDGELRARIPGYVSIDGDRLTVGDEARSRARLEPRTVRNRYWERLGDDTALPGTAGLYNADLARAHLACLWRAAGADVGGLVIAVPGDFDRRRLGLVLGIAAQLELPACAMVDGALAACLGVRDGGLVVHVGMHLHRSVVTAIDIGERARRISCERLEGLGSIGLYERLIELVRDRFVSTSRFDPLHRAQSEQAIYDRLPSWIEMLSTRDSIAIEIQADDGRAFRIELGRENVIDCIRDFHAALSAAMRESCRDRSFTLVLDADAARLPGLAHALISDGGDDVVTLTSGAGAVAASRCAGRIFETARENVLAVSLDRDVYALHGVVPAGAEMPG